MKSTRNTCLRIFGTILLSLVLTQSSFAKEPTTVSSTDRLAVRGALNLASYRSSSLGGAFSTESDGMEFVQTGSADAAASGSSAKGAMKADKTGTNPINFTHDLRIYHEYQFLNTPDDGSQNVTTFEFRTPFADGKWQFRLRARAQWLNVDTPDGVRSIDDEGAGDFDFRFLTVPILDMKNKFALATGLEVFMPTATETTLGSGALSFGPQAFAVFFNPLGIKGTLLAPAYQHKFSIAEDDGRENVHQGLIDLFLVWGSADKRYWAVFDPQIVIDYANDTDFMLIDVEVGTMLDRFFGTKGHSTYVRVSGGIGDERPTDGSIEFGYKIIW